MEFKSYEDSNPLYKLAKELNGGKEGKPLKLAMGGAAKVRKGESTPTGKPIVPKKKY